jgi:GTP cyclohydrolase III
VDYEGEKLTVTCGKEHIQPFRFQGMDIGPFEMTVTIMEGETPLDAKRRAMKHLAAMAEEEYREKLPRFQARVRESGEI